MDLGLNRRVALVAAATKGLGYAVAAQLLREGASVGICGRSAEHVDSAVAALRSEAGQAAEVAGWTADVTRAEDCERLVENVVARFGQLDILVTNAGGPPGGTFDALDMSQFESAAQLTLLSAVRLIKLALPHLRRSDAAAILTITSVSTKQPVAGLLLSNVYRPAVAGLTKTLSQELGQEGIRVNSILPGWTATERVGAILDYRSRQNATTREDEEARITANIPMGRMGLPEEFGRVAAFLVSPAASYVNGIMMPVDGGSSSGLL
jgi:3-oxoacyl-[acyl-carrier protein] reductase